MVSFGSYVIQRTKQLQISFTVCVQQEDGKWWSEKGDFSNLRYFNIPFQTSRYIVSNDV